MLIREICELKHEYYRRTGNRLHILNPKSFNEKLQWLKLFYKDYKIVICSDKLWVKKYLSKKGYSENIPKTLSVYNDADEISLDNLPSECVIKTSHGSGSVIMYNAHDAEYIFNIRKKLRNWLKKPYMECTKEWQYNIVKPRIFAESCLKNEMEERLVDYKYMCFNGKCELIFLVLNRERKRDMYVDFYDTEWNKLPFSRAYNCSNKVFSKPKQFEKMKMIAEDLAKEFPFLRVDFYIVEDKVYIGELTFFPGSGWELFDPSSYDYYYGKMLKLPDIFQCIQKYKQLKRFLKQIKNNKWEGLELWEL